MSDQPKGAGQPNIGPLYIKMTSPRTEGGVSLPGARDIFGQLSLTSQFKVSLHLTADNGPDDNLNTWLTRSGITDNAVRNAQFDFFCHDATIPGATFDMVEETGSRQGIIERFPTKRIYPDFTIQLYVDNDFKIIRLFEEWMNYINPVYGSGGIFSASPRGQGNAKNRNDFFRFKYPNTYKRIISITKFERNFKERPELSGPEIGSVPSITYRMIDAFPTNITGIPVSYSGSTVVRTTVSFSYTRYVIEKNNGTIREVTNG